MNFFHLKDQVTPFVKKLAQARFSKPVLVDNLIESVKKHKVIRIDAFVTKQEKLIVEEIIKPFLKYIELNWTAVQFDPTLIGLITVRNLSKSTALKTVTKKLNISLQDILGIGDGMNDWDFMQFCSRIGVMGNAQKELIKISEKFGKKRIVAGHVDKNGFLDILNYYNLIS